MKQQDFINQLYDAFTAGYRFAWLKKLDHKSEIDGAARDWAMARLKTVLDRAIEEVEV